MKQILQNHKAGKIDIVEIPVPALKAGHLLIRSSRSMISLGTERMLVEFGKANWFDKARQHPDKVKQVLQKIKTDGLGPTIQAVRNKLDQTLPLGYCNVGVVQEVGKGVSGFQNGDRVVSNGYHAELVSVPEHLCAKIPDDVNDTTASFTVLSSIALQGIRLIDPTLGESVAVMGLGLVGLLGCQILKANGCRVLGFDINEKKVELARQFGVEARIIGPGDDPVQTAMAFTSGQGVDAVLITAATKSNAPIEQAPKMCRQRGRVVLVGVTGLELNRADFYAKEISVQVSCSYGPGRYDQAYEKKGLDYPIGFVRWTENRNFQAVLELMANGQINTHPLVSRTFPIDQVDQAYEEVVSNPDSLGIILKYSPEADLKSKTISLKAPSIGQAESGNPVVGFIGAGGFTGAVLLPGFQKADCRLKTITSASGISSHSLGKKFGFENNSTDVESVFNDSEINVVVITTRHNTHADFIIKALRAGKHVFVEKPLCISQEEMESIIAVYSETSQQFAGQILMTGFNRRFSPCTQAIKKQLASRREPLCATLTVNAGQIPLDHWTQNPHIGGGRIIGEGCHFIDLMRFMVGSPIEKVYAATTAGHPLTNSDKVSLTMSFQDGSLGIINYFANGSKDYPKERMEVFCEAKTWVLDNFKTVQAYGCGPGAGLKLRSQDKGHCEEVRQFLAAVKDGRPSPIPFAEIVEVTQAVFSVLESVRTGLPVSIPRIIESET